MKKIISITLHNCPTKDCNNVLREGVVRCETGHWSWWWVKQSDEVVVEIRKKAPKLPLWGTVDFRKESQLRTLTAPEKKAKISTKLFPGQRVKVTEISGDYYHLAGQKDEDLGWTTHNHVVIRINVSHRPVKSTLRPELARLASKTDQKDVQASIDRRKKNLARMATADPQRNNVEEELKVLRERREELKKKK